ncbi:MAG: TonB-dependent receptor [Rudanella sp.]|nr:TonB-dependent receptor [Rudanella sp.]
MPVFTSFYRRPFIYASLLLLLLAIPQLAQAQTTHALAGYVREAKTNAPLSGVTVFVQQVRKGVTTDRDGYYILSLPAGSYNVLFTSVGYLRQVQAIKLPPSQLGNMVSLEIDTKLLDEVTVKTESADRNVKKVEMGVNQLSIRNIKRMPAFMGEVDVVRSLLLLPGVTTVGEGATGINVRGGSVDQNLVMLDDAPIYNSSHLMGFFSVFNPDAVRDVTLQKGSIPARYGGRISSILDVRSKEPETEKFTVSGGIGLVSSRLGVEGPIGKPRNGPAGTRLSKLSFLADARLSANSFLFKLGPASIRNTRANFYDLTAKVKYLPSEKNTVWVSAYASSDEIKFPSDSLISIDVRSSRTDFDYQTTNASVKWTHAFSDQFSITTTGVTAQYKGALSTPDPGNAFRLQSSLQTTIGRIEGDYRMDRHRLAFGANGTHHRLSPNTLTPGPVSNQLPLTLPNEQAVEAAIYGEDDFTITDKFSIIGGLRYVQFFNLGPTTVNTYNPEGPRLADNAISQAIFGKGAVAKSYGGLEPRLALRWAPQPDRSVKVAYTRMQQFLQLITNTQAALPTSRWKLSDANIRPQIADQLSAGYFQNFNTNTFEVSGEVYYRAIQDAIDYRDGAKILLNPTPETELLQGDGQAYGAEFMVKKNKGFLTGWVSYAYSRSLLLINGPYAGEQVNNGKWFPANFDKPHQVNIVAIYRPSLTFSASFNFTYSTGRPVTAPYAKARVNGVLVPIFLDRNQQRIPDYHRLDVSLTWDKNPEKPGKFWYSWVFSVYNLYARKNAYSVFYKLQSNSRSDAYKLSIFGSALPSLTYNFKF